GAGSACHLAARELIRQCTALAALELKVEPSQVGYAAGVFRSADSPRAITLRDLSRNGTVTVRASGSFGSTWPNGCHVAEVEIDPETGSTRIVSYCAVDDYGVVDNHAIVDGQPHGGVVTGAGKLVDTQTLHETLTGNTL